MFALEHPLLTDELAAGITETGTVKVGHFDYRYEPPWKAVFRANYQIPVTGIVLWSVFALATLGFVVAVRGMVRSGREMRAVQREVRVLMRGENMPQGISLRLKLAFFTVFLVLMIVLAVSIPLGLSMQVSQERTLAHGLEERVTVLLDSLASRARIYLPQQNMLELGFLPKETSALPEVNYATITGFSRQGQTTHTDYVWATNDPKIVQKIDTQNFAYGISRLTDTRVAESISSLDALNAQAMSSLTELSSGITELTQEALSLIAESDEASVRRIRDIQTSVNSLNEQINQTLNRISKSGEGSLPKFDSDKLDRNNTTYLFYKPVMFRQGSEQTYVHGMVYVEVSTADLLRMIVAGRTQVFATAGVIGLFALLIGILGSFTMSQVITQPIRRLVSQVALIRDTADKATLTGKDIAVASRDEIGVLGETVNALMHSLIKAAETSKDLNVGKEVQKMFIPLETDASGKKLTTGALEDVYAQFFGYYEAGGVSGDYFDYKKLDNRWYAIIKCDVSGKGVPAALIMIEVATLFLDYFDEWEYKTHGTNLTPVVSRINDLIESRGFNGRFAAFTLCLFDSIDGDLHFCNAGDNSVHIFDSRKRKMETINVPSAPAAGIFSNAEIKLQGGFPVTSLRLNAGDVLFLYTDGIEEARNPNSEEMGAARVSAIIEAIFSRTVYVLQRQHSSTIETLEFDFSGCTDNAADAIMALVSAEKVFRLYKTPDTTTTDKVLVDRKIDMFLRAHFKQYNAYCANHMDCPEAPEYLYYTGVKEAPQYDDLTLAAVRKKTPHSAPSLGRQT
jgi:serine phosphatase RsbU (regulator of sigma subunit)